MNFRPCIDIHDGKVKQIVGGSLNDETGADTNFVSEHGAGYFGRLYRTCNVSFVSLYLYINIFLLWGGRSLLLCCGNSLLLLLSCRCSLLLLGSRCCLLLLSGNSLFNLRG